MAFTFDAGILIALDRGDRRAWNLLLERPLSSGVITVPSAVVVQAWRGSRSANLSRALSSFDIEILDDSLARAAGELCGRSRTHDPVDAVVVASATRRGNAIVTTDPHDLRRLAESAPGCGPVLDLNDL